MSPAQLPQPFNFYKLILNSDALHYGYWPEGQADLSLEQAQEALTGVLSAQYPPPPARVLDIGCGLGASAGALAQQGYEVVALAPSEELITYARQHHPGPTYLACGFLDDQPLLQAPEQYDVVMLQESLQYFPDIQAVFSRIKTLLRDEKSRVILCDEVSYSPTTREHSEVKSPVEIEQTFAALGFYAAFHQIIGSQVLPTCPETLQRFADQRAELLAASDDEGKGLAHFIQGWTYQMNAYEKGDIGYEIWALRHDDLSVRTYQASDEQQILPAFNQAFGVQREVEHWQWKFLNNPQGAPCTSTAWQGHTLAAHYSGYPLRLSLSAEHSTSVQHIGDTFTMPAFRGQGRGASSLLARVFRHFERSYFERQVHFAYGFNTDKIRRFGQLFLGYTADTPVYNWQLNAERLALYRQARLRLVYLRGYSVSLETEVGDWADEVFARAREDYPWLVQRDRRYLHWRYVQNPDFDYEFYRVKRWGTTVGWWLVRKQGQHLWLGDALFCRNTAPIAIAAGLSAMLHQHQDVQYVEGWFAEKPTWWQQLLSSAGFAPTRQHEQLYLCLKSYTPDLTPTQIAEQFYFTWGDSDLF